MRIAPAALTLGLLAGCGPHHAVAAGPRRDEPGERQPALARPDAAPRASGRPYADTPISEVAEELTDLALAVADGRPPPPTEVRLRSALDGAEQARWHTDRPREAPLVIGIAFELELILKRGVPDDDAEPAERWGSLRLTLALSRNGLRLYSVRPRTMSRALPGGPLPSALAGLGALAAGLVAALRSGDVAAYALDEADRALLGNDEVWAQVQEDRVRPELVTQIAAMLATLPDAPLAYRLADVAVLAADADGRLLSYAMSWDLEGQRFVLATEPLVEIRQLWPRPRAP
ncbi:MAG: hypothetical protein KF729_00770 [Sandaracinaceae bacterium]|nr:hypothetical protein [Sandaracinaceae bacterium]